MVQDALPEQYHLVNIILKGGAKVVGILPQSRALELKRQYREARYIQYRDRIVTMPTPLSIVGMIDEDNINKTFDYVVPPLDILVMSFEPSLSAPGMTEDEIWSP